MYTVVAQREIPAPVSKVWAFITQPDLLAMWFADITSFTPKEPFRFEFGDGDFFSGRIEEWDPQILLGMRWKFMDIGPTYEIRYSLLRRKEGTEISIQDRGALTVEEAECLRVGWSEFLMRMAKAIQRDRIARFNWRKAITFTAHIGEEPVELRAALRDPLWYKESFAGVKAEIFDGGEKEILVGLTSDKWGDIPTSIRLVFKRIRDANYLFVAHEGWPDLSSKVAESERIRFADLWLKGLAKFSVK